LRQRQRGAKRQSVTKTINTIRGSSALNEANINFYIDKLTELKSDLIKLDGDTESDMIVNTSLSQYDWEQHSESCEAYQDNIGLTLTLLKSELKRLSTATVRESGSEQSGSNSSSLPKLKLPEVQLPKFDGKPENFEKFMDSIEKLLGKFALTQFEKYHYLLNHVTGPARLIVESVPYGNNNYDVAKQLLSDAFSNKTNQQFSVIESFIKLKLDCDTHPYGWVSECRVLVQQMIRLDITGEIFAQYFVWRSLSDKLRQQFMSVTNKSKPELKDILDNAFNVIDRIGEGRDKLRTGVMSRNFDESTTLATNVKVPSKSKPISYRNCCWLCDSTNDPQAAKHRVHNCKKFATAEAKLSHIKSLGGCVKCGLLNHSVSECKFNFAKTCDNCGSSHASFLCTNKTKAKTNDKQPKGAGQKQNRETSANLVEFNVMPTSNSSDIIIPTFTVNLPSKNNKTFDARCMYDPASQTTFITEFAIKKLKYKVIQPNLKIKITGFNGSKTYESKQIEVFIKLNDKLKKIKAVVVPYIRSRIKSSLFGTVCSEFKAQNLPLADKHLTDRKLNGRIDMLLGVDAAFVLPVHSCSFGTSDRLSTLYYCSAGLMLAGNLSDLVHNFDSLPNVKQFIDCLSGTF